MRSHRLRVGAVIGLCGLTYTKKQTVGLVRTTGRLDVSLVSFKVMAQSVNGTESLIVWKRRKKGLR